METISYKKFIAQLTDKAYREDVPLNGSFELTPLCNLDCKMCYVHLQDPSVRHRMLSGKQWIGLMEQAISKGMMTALLTGGEAMTHPDFWEIYMYLINQGISIRLKTNGLLLTEENVARLVEYEPYVIDVSLYGCNSESYLAVTGKDAYQTVVDNIRRAIAAGLQLRIMVTPSGYMSPWTEQVMELAKTFGVKVVVNSILFEPNENTDRHKEDFDLTEAENDRILQKKAELFPPKYMSPEEEADIYGAIEKRPDVQEKGLYCNGGRTTFAINWDGTMGPCLDFPRAIINAHPLSDGFAQAWHEVNQGMKNYAVPQKCHSCKLNNKCHYCPTQHSKVATQHQCDASVCAYWANVYKDNNKSR